MITTSPKYNFFFKLGANRELSKCELSTLLERLSISNIHYEQFKDYIFVHLPFKNKSRIIQLLNQTGSIVKAGYLTHAIPVKDLSSPNFSSFLQEWIEKELFPNLSSTKHKFKIGLNCYLSSEIQDSFYSKIYFALSNFFKNSRLQFKKIPTNRQYFDLPPFQYHKDRIPSRGKELSCFQLKSKILLGYTFWVTNPLEDMKVDESRPVRFFTHGTSIKVARTLIFLAKAPEKGTILDPFCGTGTILIQGIKYGYKMIGIDRDVKCIRAAKTNLRALSQYISAKRRDKDWVVIHHDSRYLNQVVKEKVDAVVTEPYLGPFLKKMPPPEEAEETVYELTKLYTTVLKKARNILNRGGRVVFIMPVYRYGKNQEVTLNHYNIAEEIEMKVLEKMEFFDVTLPVNIGRKHNIIGRKIVIFVKEE